MPVPRPLGIVPGYSKILQIQHFQAVSSNNPVGNSKTHRQIQASWQYPRQGWGCQEGPSWYFHSRTCGRTWFAALRNERQANFPSSDSLAWHHDYGPTWQDQLGGGRRKGVQCWCFYVSLFLLEKVEGWQFSKLKVKYDHLQSPIVIFSVNSKLHW